MRRPGMLDEAVQDLRQPQQISKTSTKPELCAQRMPRSLIPSTSRVSEEPGYTPGCQVYTCLLLLQAIFSSHYIAILRTCSFPSPPAPGDPQVTEASPFPGGIPLSSPGRLHYNCLFPRCLPPQSVSSLRTELMLPSLPFTLRLSVAPGADSLS